MRDSQCRGVAGAVVFDVSQGQAAKWIATALARQRRLPRSPTSIEEIADKLLEVSSKPQENARRHDEGYAVVTANRSVYPLHFGRSHRGTLYVSLFGTQSRCDGCSQVFQQIGTGCNDMKTSDFSRVKP
jgi:hypothetical protein